jgi:ADP-heptose:LPS heptosyltransferase
MGSDTDAVQVEYIDIPIEGDPHGFRCVRADSEEAKAYRARKPMTCDCQEDGFCQRYNREMHGRLRQICQGENIDPGMAEQYRALWRAQANGHTPTLTDVVCPFAGAELRDEDDRAVTRECWSCGGKKLKVFNCKHPSREPDQVTVDDCSQCAYRPVPHENATHLLLRNNLCPGDVIVSSAAIYSLHKLYPGKYLTAVEGTATQIWEHNPHVVPVSELDNPRSVEMHYPLIHECNQRAVHFMQGYCDYLGIQLGIPLPLMTNRPRIYVSSREKTWMDQVHQETGRKQRFWLVNAGYKNDFTNKWWGLENFQRVVDILRGRVQFVQIGENSQGHNHPPLKGVINFIGKTDTRQLIRLCYHADGVLCGITFLQHLAAALEKPCVCILGGREPVQWNSYPRQQLMHTIGMMTCTEEAKRGEGCWRSRTVPAADADEKNKSICAEPVTGADETIPRCMAIIAPERVAEIILNLRERV